MLNTSGRVKDLTRVRFGRLVVKERSGTHRPNGEAIWRCECDCGNSTEVRGTKLRSGVTQSCGCFASERTRARNSTRRRDLTGRRFGKYLVLRFAEARPSAKGGTMSVWLCRCDCGTEKLVQYSGLMNGRQRGCFMCANGYLSEEDFVVRAVRSSYQASARVRGIGFHLTAEDFKDLIFAPCHYCNRSGVGIFRSYKRPGMAIPYNGVDRVDGGDYIRSEVVTCCWTCNNMKGSLKQTDFLRHCSLIGSRFS